MGQQTVIEKKGILFLLFFFVVDGSGVGEDDHT